MEAYLLASIPTYLLSIISKFPKWAIDMINSQIAQFFSWNNTEDRHQYNLANWKLVAQKKEFGALCINDLRNLNICLLWPPGSVDVIKKMMPVGSKV